MSQISVSGMDYGPEDHARQYKQGPLARIAQLVEASDSSPEGSRFESECGYVKNKVIHFIKKWRTEWAWFTVFTYVLAIPFTIIIFPDSSLWLGLLVVFGGLTAALNDLGDAVDEE